MDIASLIPCNGFLSFCFEALSSAFDCHYLDIFEAKMAIIIKGVVDRHLYSKANWTKIGPYFHLISELFSKLTMPFVTYM